MPPLASKSSELRSASRCPCAAAIQLNSRRSISEEFDRRLLSWMAAAQGHLLADLSSEDLLANGGIEMRSWITVLGAVGDTAAQVLAYEPFYSAIMAMGVAYWQTGAKTAEWA